MRLRDNVKYFMQNIFAPKTSEYADYKNSLKMIQYNTRMYSEYLNDGNHDSESKRWEYALNESKRQAQFVRPNMKDDIDYRNKILNQIQIYKLLIP